MLMQTFQSHDGATLAYSDTGSGTGSDTGSDRGEGLPILCLSGLTRNASDFDYLAPHLAGNRLICLDYRGRGQSEWTDPDSYTIPIEGRDALCLLDHLGLEKAAVIGTSRGGLIAMTLAATAKDRLLGVCLNDIGPELRMDGLEAIRNYIGKNPVAKSIEDLAKARARTMQGFAYLPDSRWLEEAQMHYIDSGNGITINYDPELACIFDAPAVAADLWPLFDALEGLPLALIRGANSDLLSAETAAEMQKRRPDMIFAEVPDRGHIPFLDEAEALAAIHTWVTKMR